MTQQKISCLFCMCQQGGGISLTQPAADESRLTALIRRKRPWDQVNLFSFSSVPPSLLKQVNTPPEPAGF